MTVSTGRQHDDGLDLDAIMKQHRRAEAYSDTCMCGEPYQSCSTLALVVEVWKLRKRCDLLAMQGAGDATAMWDAEAERDRLRDAIREHREAMRNADKLSAPRAERRLWAHIDGEEPS